MIFRSLYTIYLCRRDKDKRRDDLKKSTEQMRVRDCRRVSPFRGICLSRKARPPLGGNAQNKNHTRQNKNHRRHANMTIYFSFSLYIISFFLTFPFVCLRPTLLGRLHIVLLLFAGKKKANYYRCPRHLQILSPP